MLTTKELGRRVKTAIQKAGVSQAKLAEECGVTPQAVSGWLRTGRIAKRHLTVIATLTKQDLDYFLGANDSALTKINVPAEDADDVLKFLSAGAEWKELWLQVVKNNDARLARIIDLYERANDEGKQMILNGARGTLILRGEDEQIAGQAPKRADRKRT